MSAAEIEALWLFVMCDGDAELDDQGEIKGWRLGFLFAFNDVRRRAVLIG